MIPSVQPRYLEVSIQEDALQAGKMAFISGPRQVGKTTLGKRLLGSVAKENYFNWDDQAFRKSWVRDPVGSLASRDTGPVLLDEIHKDRQWKSRLKGLYDLRGDDLSIIVTGSARLDLFRKGGDSLMGRYLPYRLHPFSVGERVGVAGPDQFPVDDPGAPRSTGPSYPWDDLLELGTFPEPVLAGSRRRARRWSRLRGERLVFEDVRDLRQIRDLQALRVLVDLLPERVGSILSINSLREDIGVAFATVRDWIHMLEALYHCFLIRPHGGRLKRTLTANPKLYLFDILQIDDRAARRENLTALHLLKACHFWTDLGYDEFELRFLRTKECEEVDFVVVRNGRAWWMIECKSGDPIPSKSLVKYAEKCSCPYRYQLVDLRGHDRWFEEPAVRVIDYESFFKNLV